MPGGQSGFAHLARPKDTHRRELFSKRTQTIQLGSNPYTLHFGTNTSNIKPIFECSFWQRNSKWCDDSLQ
jgi:hypothetical protein